jgi:hypothetical protein
MIQRAFLPLGRYAILWAIGLSPALIASACGRNNVPSDHQSTSSSTSSGGAGNGGSRAGGSTECFTNPVTHVEIINACTDVETIDKTPNLPLLHPKGELPPLP